LAYRYPAGFTEIKLYSLVAIFPAYSVELRRINDLFGLELLDIVVNIGTGGHKAAYY
jgi:hypothetical protein